MQRVIWLMLIFINGFVIVSAAQSELPNILVKNINSQIVISWKNNYKKTITNINIQRSYDSLKNYTTIGTVLNPQNTENGYADENTPYTKMYYRVFVSFEGGSYFFSPSLKPVKDVLTEDKTVDSLHPYKVSDNWLSTNTYKQPVAQTIIVATPASVTTYPSQYIFTAKDNNVNIYLPDAQSKNYMIKFFDENKIPVFELHKLPENYFILEKVNFLHGGWFYFELFENAKLIEKNKLYISKELKETSK